MRRLFIILLALVLCASLCACDLKSLFPGKQEDPVEPDPPIDTPSDPSGGYLLFKTTDLDGREVTFADYSDCKLILINLWEPWCGPCLSEMPDLQKLYEKYADSGFIILGVFGYDTDDNAKEAVSDTGVKYPILHYSDDFAQYESMYVPTSVFLDSEGNRLNEDDLIGSMSYEDWEVLIKKYLEEVG